MRCVKPLPRASGCKTLARSSQATVLLRRDIYERAFFLGGGPRGFLRRERLIKGALLRAVLLELVLDHVQQLVLVELLQPLQPFKLTTPPLPLQPLQPLL